jgi:type VI secretion system protein ImpA
MASPAVIDVEALAAPVPGDAPAGVPLPGPVRSALDEARKEADPLDPTSAGRRADWAGVIRQASDALTRTSKDLLAAARLTEALARKHEFAGLRDGFRLLTKLVTDGWDRIHPMPEDGEGFDVRGGPLKWLNDSTRGARFPHAVAGLPLFRARGDAFGYLDWVQPERKAEMEAAIPAVDADKLRATYDDLQEARAALEELGRALDEKFGEDSPDLTSTANPTNLGSSLEKCADLMASVMRSRGISLDGEEAAAGEAAGEAESAEAAPAAAATGSREALYRQLSQIASALERLEPHSPIPYLLRRCVRLGSLPFPELMRAMIREAATLDEIDRLLGLERPESGG